MSDKRNTVRKRRKSSKFVFAQQKTSTQSYRQRLAFLKEMSMRAPIRFKAKTINSGVIVK